MYVECGARQSLYIEEHVDQEGWRECYYIVQQPH